MRQATHSPKCRWPTTRHLSTAGSEPIFGVAAAAAATPLPQPPFSSEGLRRRPTPFSRSQASGSRQFEWTAARRGAPPPPRATATRAVLRRSKATATTTRYASSLHVDWWAAWGRHLCGVGLHAALAVLALNTTIETRRRRHDHGHELIRTHHPPPAPLTHTLPPDRRAHTVAILPLPPQSTCRAHSHRSPHPRGHFRAAVERRPARCKELLAAPRSRTTTPPLRMALRSPRPRQ